MNDENKWKDEFKGKLLSLSISEVDIHAVLQMVIIELKCLK